MSITRIPEGENPMSITRIPESAAERKPRDDYEHDPPDHELSLAQWKARWNRIVARVQAIQNHGGLILEHEKTYNLDRARLALSQAQAGEQVRLPAEVEMLPWIVARQDPRLKAEENDPFGPGDILRPRRLVVLYGPSGAGKTLWAMHAAACTVAQGGSVLYLAGRLGEAESWRARLCRGLGAGDEALERFELTQTSRPRPDLLAWHLQRAGQDWPPRGPRLLVIDEAAEVYTGDMRRIRGTRRWLLELQARWHARYRAAVLLVHRTNQGGGMYGAPVIRDCADRVLRLDAWPDGTRYLSREKGGVATSAERVAAEIGEREITLSQAQSVAQAVQPGALPAFDRRTVELGEAALKRLSRRALKAIRQQPGITTAQLCAVTRGISTGAVVNTVVRHLLDANHIRVCRVERRRGKPVLGLFLCTVTC